MLTPPTPDTRNATNIPEGRSHLTNLGSLGSVSATSVEQFSPTTIARFTTRFLRACSPELLAKSTEELHNTIKPNDLSALREALSMRFMGVTAKLSEHIVSRLASPISALYPQRIALSLRWSGFQIHPDTNTCFWMGEPLTIGDFRDTILQSINEARPFQCEELRTVLAETIQGSIYTGSIDIPNFRYAAITPDFVTLEFDNQ